MTVGAAISASLPFLRAQAESMMTDTCTITTPSAETPTFNDASGVYDTHDPVAVYSGKCRARPLSHIMRERLAESGESQKSLWRYVVALPFGTTVPLGATVTLNACADPALVGVPLRVNVVAKGADLTATRLECEEVANNG